MLIPLVLWASSDFCFPTFPGWLLCKVQELDMAADTEATSLGGTEHIQEYSKLSGTLERLTYTQQACKSTHCSIIWKPMAESKDYYTEVSYVV